MRAKAAWLAIALLLGPVTIASAQPFELTNASGVRSHWFDGFDLLVTGESRGVVLRHRNGVTRQFAGPNAAVAGRGQGLSAEIIALTRNRVSRLRSGSWHTSVIELGSSPDHVVMAPNGEAIGWSTFNPLLVRVGAANVATRIELPIGQRPVEVLVSTASEFIVVLGSRSGFPSNVLMRLQGGRLVPHPDNASAMEEVGCRNPKGAVQLSDGSLVLYRSEFLCHLVAGSPPEIVTRGNLVGEMRRIRTLASDGTQVVIADSDGGLSRWQPGANAATPLSVTTARSAGGLFVDPLSDTIAMFEGGPVQVVSASLGHSPLGASSDGAWIRQIAVDDEAERRPTRGGMHLVLPVGRLGFGGMASLRPSGPGAFAFDLVGGVRFLFRDGERHPVVAAEFGYSRRGGSLDTNDLLVTLVAGYASVPLGLQLAESVVFALGEGRSGIGLRSAVRVTTLFDTFGLEIGHGVEFDNGRHELRILFNIELAQLIMIGDLFRRVSR